MRRLPFAGRKEKPGSTVCWAKEESEARRFPKKKSYRNSTVIEAYDFRRSSTCRAATPRKNENRGASVGQTGSLPRLLQCGLSGKPGKLPVCPTHFGEEKNGEDTDDAERGAGNRPD